MFVGKKSLMVFSLLLVSVVGSFAKAQDGTVNASLASPAPFEAYSVFERQASSVDVFVDYETVEVDCNGLPFRYEQIATENKNVFLIVKTEGYVTRRICLPGTEQRLVTGTTFRVSSPRARGVYTTILAPAGSRVQLKVNLVR